MEEYYIIKKLFVKNMFPSTDELSSKSEYLPLKL